MTKGNYVDGFVMVIPKKNNAKYLKMAREGCATWMKFGALDYKECIMDDMNAKHVSLTFPKLTKLKPGEAVWFSFIVFKSKAHRNEVNKKVMAYFADKYKDQSADMPFDMKRMSYGGFEVKVGV